MRCLLPLLCLLMNGCGLKQVLPGTAVLGAQDSAAFDHPIPASVVYTGAARSAALFPPLQVFGLQYAVDIVIVTQHDDWEMHEYARLDTPKGNIWIAKDARTGGAQTIVSDAPGLKSWLPEIPIPRIEAPVAVVDRSSGADIDLQISYTNPDGAPVEVRTKGHMPDHPPAKRNGNTMGHSADIVAAVLDLERMGADVTAQMRIGGSDVPVDKLLGLMPFNFLLRQTQGGVAITSFRVDPTADGFTLTRPAAAAEDWPTQSTEHWSQDASSAGFDNGICRFDAHYLAGGLAHVDVRQHGVDEPVFSLRLSPALPDLRRPFTGSATSRFRMDVGGQRGHGTGRIEARWLDADTVQLRLIPTAPDWLVDRPMRTRIVYGAGATATVHTVRD